MKLNNIYNMDCLNGMAKLESKSIDICITSPPYNLDIKYSKYEDNKKDNEYLEWMDKIFIELKRIIKDDGNIFLNVGYSNIKPWIAMDVAQVARKYFILQNNIVWVKSICVDQSYGNFKPISSDRYMSPTWENLFHFTKNGDVVINKSAIGVEHKYSSKRGGPNCPVNRFRGRLVKKLGYKGVKDFNVSASEVDKKYVEDQVDLKDKELPQDQKRDRGNSWYVPYDTIQSKSEKGNHPAIFPEKLIEYCIKVSGIENGLVLDPFMGTGTVAVAAKRLGLNFIGFDIDQDYINFAKERLNDI